MKKLIVTGTMMLLLFGFSGQSMAGIHIGINIPLPPVFGFPAPPELVVIPGTYVYYCPDAGFDIFFYDGYWYRSYGGYWYSAASYDGPWVYLASPPYALLSLPPDYGFLVRGERRIPFGELHRNWRAWERGRYWEHHNWGRVGQANHYGATHYGVAPSFRERGYRGHAGAVRGGGGVHGNVGRVEHQRYHGVAPSFRERGRGGFGGTVHGGGPVRGGGTIHGGGGVRGGTRQAGHVRH